MPAIPSCVLEPLWAQLCSRLSDRPSLGLPPPTHPQPRGLREAGPEAEVRLQRPRCAPAATSGRPRACSGRGNGSCWRATTPWSAWSWTTWPGGLTKAPCGDEGAGPSPVDRGTQGIERSTLTEPKAEAELAACGLRGRIARRSRPAPIPVGQRWPVERTHAWVNHLRTPARGTERGTAVIELWLSLAHAIITLRRLIREAWVRYRWDARPSRCP